MSMLRPHGRKRRAAADPTVIRIHASAAWRSRNYISPLKDMREGGVREPCPGRESPPGALRRGSAARRKQAWHAQCGGYLPVGRREQRPRSPWLSSVGTALGAKAPSTGHVHRLENIERGHVHRVDKPGLARWARHREEGSHCLGGTKQAPTKADLLARRVCRPGTSMSQRRFPADANRSRAKRPSREREGSCCRLGRVVHRVDTMEMSVRVACS